MALTIAFQRESSGDGLYVFHAVAEGKRIATITIDSHNATLTPEYLLPRWAIEQLIQACFDWMADVAGEPRRDPKLQEIKPATH